MLQEQSTSHDVGYGTSACLAQAYMLLAGLHTALLLEVASHSSVHAKQHCHVCHALIRAVMTVTVVAYQL